MLFIWRKHGHQHVCDVMDAQRESHVRSIRRVYEKFGVRPIALGVHKENHGAERFYLHHGFVKTDCFAGNDRYYLRYPAQRED